MEASEEMRRGVEEEASEEMRRGVEEGSTKRRRTSEAVWLL